jgi:hypothetical protein
MGIVVEGSHGTIFNRDISYRVDEGLEDPPPYKEITTSSVEYLTERGVHASVLNLLRRKVYDTAKGLLFLYPDWDYWQERRWTAFSPPRWVNPSVAAASPATGVTYHLRTHYDSTRVVLVEGILDALRVAPFENVAAMLSSKYHERQLMELEDSVYESVLIYPDRDVAVTKRIEYVDRCGAWFPRVQFVHPSGQFHDDPGCTPDSILKEIIDV